MSIERGPVQPSPSRPSGACRDVWLTISAALCATALLLFVLRPAGAFAAPEGHTSGPHDHGSPAVATSSADDNFFLHLLKTYVPRAQCMYHEQGLVVLHLASDALIAAAYYSIPITLVHFVRRRRDVAFSWVFWLFAMFILACGTTHVMGVLAIWTPYYRLDGVIKLVTAALSIGTAIALWPLIPKALALPSPSQLEQTVQQRTAELNRANADLREERDAKTTLLDREREARAQAERARADAERSAREAEAANRVKDEFLATLSHELRTPLTAILGWSRVIERTHREDRTIGPAIEVINRNARAQAHLVDDLLDMNRIVSGKLQLDARPVRVSEVVAAAVESVGPTAATKRVALSVEPAAPADAVVLADAARLQQVLWNLLSNAVKFTPAGGRVTVACGRADGRIAIRVIDTGEGIAADFMPHVFDRFRQADATITRRFGGLGLGLSIVRHLVEMHGGRVGVESAGLGRGATFTVDLPALPVDGASVSPEPRRHRADLNVSLRGVKALVVDDELDARQLVGHILREAGATAILAGSAAEALDLLKHRPDVIVCDIGMPGEDGYTFIRKVRQLPLSEGRGTPAIALTAFARPEDRVQALLAGFQLHVAKPIDEGELLLVLASVVARPSAAGQEAAPHDEARG